MTWSLTLEGLPLADAKAKPHDCKQNYKKRTIRKHGIQWENSLKFSDARKNKNKILDFSKHPVEHTVPK